MLPVSPIICRRTVDMTLTRQPRLDNSPCLCDRYEQLRGIVEDSLGAGDLPPDLPPDDKLIAAGAAAVVGDTAGPDAEAHAALKGTPPNMSFSAIRRLFYGVYTRYDGAIFFAHIHLYHGPSRLDRYFFCLKARNVSKRRSR